MTRQHLERFIAEFGIVDASILLHCHPITLERWRNGQDDIPKKEAEWLAAVAVKIDESLETESI